VQFHTLAMSVSATESFVLVTGICEVETRSAGSSRVENELENEARERGLTMGQNRCMIPTLAREP
jgi:hypothetical protein